MLCYDFVVNPLLAYPLIQVGAQESRGSYFELLARYYSTFHMGTGPLWFVEALLIFAILYVLWRAVTTSKREGGQRRFPTTKQVTLFAFILGTVTFIVRIWLPLGWAFGPLNLQFPFFPQYICLFVVGILAYRNNWFMLIEVTMGRVWLTIAIIFIVILFPALFVSGGALNGDVSAFAGGVHWQCFAYALWEQFVGVAMIVGLVVLFREKLNLQGRLAKAMSASAYTAYIIHAPVVVFLSLAMRDVQLYPLVKFAVAALIAVPACFGLGNLIRNLPLARRIL